MMFLSFVMPFGLMDKSWHERHHLHKRIFRRWFGTMSISTK